METNKTESEPLKPDMASTNTDYWESAYQKLLKDPSFYGIIPMTTQNPERRVHPRFLLGSQAISCDFEAQYRIRELSLSGFSFFSKAAYEKSRMISLSMENTYNQSAMVVSVEKAEDRFEDGAKPGNAAFGFLIRSQFLETLDPMRFLMMIRYPLNLAVTSIT